jgi:hypothetical protein
MIKRKKTDVPSSRESAAHHSTSLAQCAQVQATELIQI